MNSSKKPNGLGVCRYTSDYAQAYYGDWDDGVVIKEGLFVMPKAGVRCFGQWRKGKIHGFRVRKMSGAIAFGEFIATKLHGYMAFG